MKRLFLLLLVAICTQATFGQTSVFRNGKLLPNVSTKTLKKILASNFERKSYKTVILISDTLLKRNRNDKDTRQKRVVSEVFLKRDTRAIADIKLLDKNRDSAATAIASVPVSFDGIDDKRSALYIKSAIAYAPKNGIPYMMYAAVLADANKTTEALQNAEKGWDLLSEKYKPQFLDMFSMVLFECDNKESAYEILANIINEGEPTTNIINRYFSFFTKDQRFDEGIAKATNLYNKTSDVRYLSARAHLHNKNGNNESACEDAAIIKEKTDSDEEQLLFDCPQIMADVTPTPARTYIYNVNFQNRDYDFRVSSPNVNMDEGASFRFKMTGDNSITGKVIIGKEALATAHDQNNNFTNGDLSLTDKTSVWVSKEVFKELKEKGSSVMGADSWGAKEYSVVDNNSTDSKYYPVNIDGENLYIKCIKVVSEDGQEIWIADDAENPLILKMNISFVIELKEVI